MQTKVYIFTLQVLLPPSPHKKEDDMTGQAGGMRMVLTVLMFAGDGGGSGGGQAVLYCIAEMIESFFFDESESEYYSYIRKFSNPNPNIIRDF